MTPEQLAMLELLVSYGLAENEALAILGQLVPAPAQPVMAAVEPTVDLAEPMPMMNTAPAPAPMGGPMAPGGVKPMSAGAVHDPWANLAPGTLPPGYARPTNWGQRSPANGPAAAPTPRSPAVQKMTNAVKSSGAPPTGRPYPGNPNTYGQKRVLPPNRIKTR